METKLSIDFNNLKAHSTGLLQGVAYRALNDHLVEILSQFNLSIPQWKLLGQLYDHGEMSLNDLSKLLGIEPPLTTRMILELSQKKLVDKVTNEADKRGKIVSISKEGVALIDEIEIPVKKTLSSLLNGVTREEILIYIKVLALIVNNSNKNQSNNFILKGGEKNE